MFATHLHRPLNLTQYSVTVSKRESEDSHLDASTVRLENYVQVRMWSSWMTRQGFWTLWYELEPTERLSSTEYKRFCVLDRLPSGSGNIRQKGASLDAAARGSGEEIMKPWLTVDTVPEGYFHIPCLADLRRFWGGRRAAAHIWWLNCRKMLQACLCWGRAGGSLAMPGYSRKDMWAWHLFWGSWLWNATVFIGWECVQCLQSLSFMTSKDVDGQLHTSLQEACTLVHG